MDKLYDELGEPGWHQVRTAAELADALHEAAVRKYPDGGYARLHDPVVDRRKVVPVA
jgi:hypothetical protein